MYKTIILLFFLFVGINVTSLFAEDASNSSDNANNKKIENKQIDNYLYKSEEIVVTAKRSKEKVFNSNRTVAVLSKDTLKELSPRTTPEALMETGGIFVQKTNHGGGSPIVRGLIGPQVLISIDGIRLNNSVYRTGPLQYLNLIDTFSTDRIEVLYGPGSVLYGSDAMGGVVQMFTLSPAKYRNSREYQVSGNFITRYETADRGLAGHGHVVLDIKDFGFAGGVTKKKYSELRGGKGIDRQPYTGYEQDSAFSNFEYIVPDGALKGWRFSAAHIMTQIADAGRTDKLYDKNKLKMYDNKDHILYGRIDMNNLWLHTTGTITGSYQYFFENAENISLEENLKVRSSATRDETWVNTTGLDINFKTPVIKDKINLQYGAMWYHDAVGSRQYNKSDYHVTNWEMTGITAYPDKSTYDNYGLFVMTDFYPVKDKNKHTLGINVGYRFHGMKADAPERGTLEKVSFSDTGHIFLGGLQYIYKSQATVAFTFSQGFRSPNLQESAMLGDTGKFFHVPNSNLGPETTNTFELLTRWHWKRLSIGITGYYSFIEEIIKREPTTYEGLNEVDGKTVYKNSNGDRAIIYGVESNLSILLIKGIIISGNFTYTYGRELVDDGADDYVSRIPPMYGMLKVKYNLTKTKKLTSYIEAYIKSASRQNKLSDEDVADVRIPDDGTPDWTTYNIRGAVVINRTYRISCAIENLTNEEYKYHASGVYAAGFNVILTLDAMF